MPDRVASPSSSTIRGLVINFNAPELNYLATGLANEGQLVRYVRPYVNKGRLWERAIASLPLAGRAYMSSFGRRRIDNRSLVELTQEAGVIPDIAAAAIARAHFLPTAVRQGSTHRLHEALRRSVSMRGAERLNGVNCIVAYQGFAYAAFEAFREFGQGKAVLNYPIAHHREQFAVQAQESEREPGFAATWPDYSHWPDGYEEQLDREIALADGVLVGSTYAKETFIAAGVDPAKLHVASYGVDHSIFNAPDPQLRPARFHAIYAGLLTQRKGVSYLLRAWKKFRRPGTQLTLVGNFVTDEEPFRPFSDLFRHVPHLTRPALAQQYRESDVFVFPTLLEGMGLVVLEAMACGLPVIVTANGPGDIVRDGIDGYVVPIRDEAAIVDRLERLYANPALRVEMGRNARRRSLEFGWGQYTSKVTEYLAAGLGSVDPVVRVR
jgi:glycosyltransferase involved in cell wall biosynthesis